jgi:superfamily II DNA or RNA helicase
MQQLGIYEQLITQLIESKLDRNRYYIDERSLTSSEAAKWLANFLAPIFEYAIAEVPSDDDQLSNQIDLANKLLLWLKQQFAEQKVFADNLLDSKGKILRAIYDTQNPIAHNLKDYVENVFPLTGLRQSELFCGSNAGISLETELKREILSADKIYWLVSFIKWTGIRIFSKELEEFTASGRQLRIITTSYMGATDAKAVEYLSRLPNTEVKLSYNTNRERLHAKSYLFLRNTGFHTGYIGSSNLSHSALTSGLEWNLKITSKEIPHIIEKSLNTFESYWASNEFELFDGSAASKTKLSEALQSASVQKNESPSFFFEIKPYAHQRDVLEQLNVERQLHGRWKNLVVAATGTGKTLISAFDFARFLKTKPEATFLFVAHREEILKQARNAYRGVLRHSNFGELWVGGNQPAHYRQLFASIQTLNNQLDTLKLSADFYDYVVIDEVHHVTAQTYRKLMGYFTPQILLGLTATPERHDGGDILADFSGVIAAEIRLPEAINQRHLCPFQYFAVDDDTDLRKVSWSNGRYDISQLTNLYTHNHVRVNKILQEMQRVITDVKQMRALAFCVSHDHADYMLKQFRFNRIKADILTSDNSHERAAKQQALRSGEINILCVVDIFNEGVDIPEVDTLLFLRPTESLTIFLQQLGRGLRLADDKQCCTVLDFVGNARQEYDFASKFRALIGRSNTAISNEIEQGFPNAPLGCSIQLSKQAQDLILTNIKNAIFNARRLQLAVQHFSQHHSEPLNLINFLRLNPTLEIRALYKHRGWVQLLQETNALPHYRPACSSLNVAEEANLGFYTEPTVQLRNLYKRALTTRIIGCDDFGYLQYLHALCIQGFENIGSQDPRATMCHYDFWQTTGEKAGFTRLQDSLKALAHPLLCSELAEVVSWQMQQLKHKQSEIPNLPNVPLRLHARYAREQILAAFGATTFTKQIVSREGVYVVKKHNVELLFVTLNKNPKVFSPNTMYHDYAINESLFHWQSQNSARPDSGKGLDYIHHKATSKRICLFVREQSDDEFGNTIGFVNFGEVEYVSHTGSQPMNIIWQLQNPMPDFMWHDTAKLAMG